MKRLMLIVPVALASLAQSPAPQGIRTELFGSRPLSEAADWIEKEFGVCVNYEDPEYRDPRNLEDLTAEVASLPARQKNPSLRVVVPRRVSLEVLSPAPTVGLSEADLFGVANSAVLDHNTRGNPGVFRVISSDRRLSFVPTQGSDSIGRDGPVGVLLDTRLQLRPLRARSRDAVLVVLTALESSTQKKVKLGMIPANLLSMTEVDLPEGEGPARDLLIRLLDEMKWSDKRLSSKVPKVSWRLYFDQMMDAFVLNLHVVMVETKNIEGDTITSPLR